MRRFITAATLSMMVTSSAGQAPQAANPCCGYSKERNTVTLQLFCDAGVIDAIDQAFFGTPKGSCSSGYVADPTCDDPTFLAYARATCVGKPNCTLTSQGSDPCSGIVKSIAAVAHCSEAPGCWAPAPPLPNPSCSKNGVPCPPPIWEPTWNLTRSTVIQPSGDNYFMPKHPWGLISLDWSVANKVWYHGNRSNTTCEATSITGCRMLKAAGLADRCFIYHNMELALQWLESQRAVMYDKSYQDYFLRYTDGKGNKIGAIYNEPITFGDQFFWDFTNTSAAQYYIKSVMQVLGDDAVDGTFTDDVDGVPAEHPDVQGRINMTDAQLAQLQYATLATNMLLIESLVPAGKYNWQAFGADDGVNAAPNKGNCVTWMRTNCLPARQGQTMLMQMDNAAANANQTVAAFLVTRPPYGYLGWGWESDDKDWNDIFYLQVGEPLAGGAGLCTEGPTGVFTRTYTSGTASLDCNTWQATLPFGSLVGTA